MKVGERKFRNVEVVWACVEKRRRISGQENDGDRDAREKKERKTEAEVVGQHQERLVGEKIVRGRSTNGGVS